MRSGGFFRYINIKENKMLNKKTVLVTGGGFLGSHLCEKLLEENRDVLCIDNFFTGSKANIVQLLPNPSFELMRHNVTFPLYVEIDEIYNLACPASPIRYQYDPVQTTKTSVHGTINVLGLAKSVIDLTSSRSQLEFKPLPFDDPKQRQPDITLAKKTLNWNPQMPLEEGLQRTIDHFRSTTST